MGNLRIAHRHVPSNSKIKKCASLYRHIHAVKLNLYERSKDKTFLWTMMRQPTSQFVSDFFHFKVGRGGKHPTLQKFKKYVKKRFHGVNRPQINVISPRLLTLEDLKNE